tara:strand:+ start:261 stop:404 length:144 start_codon:yes stop_codon:yes gene_type:complete
LPYSNPYFLGYLPPQVFFLLGLGAAFLGRPIFLPYVPLPFGISPPYE